MKKQLATITATVAGTLAIFGLATVAINNATAYECQAGTVIVQHGDTAWGIASQYCEGHTGAATDAIVDAHGSASLQVGERITLP